MAVVTTGSPAAHRLDECDAERLWSRVRLAMNVGGGEELGDVRSLPEEPDPVCDTRALRGLLQRGHVRLLGRPLRSPPDPNHPLGGRVPQPGEGLEKERVPLPRFESACLDDDLRRHPAQRSELVPARATSGIVGIGGALPATGVVNDLGAGGREEKRDGALRRAAIGDDEIGRRPA